MYPAIERFIVHRSLQFRNFSMHLFYAFIFYYFVLNYGIFCLLLKFFIFFLAIFISFNAKTFLS